MGPFVAYVLMLLHRGTDGCIALMLLIRCVDGCSALMVGLGHWIAIAYMVDI